MKKTLRHLKNTIHHPIAILVTCICITLVAGFGFAFYGKADIAVFYPKTCLGGWQNVSHAEGEPQIEDNEVSQFNAENSAFLKNRVSQLYCGEFEGEIPEGNEKQQRIKLKFSWAAISEATTDAAGVIEIKGDSHDENSQDEDEGVIILDNKDADTQTESGFTIDPGEDFSNSSLNSIVDPVTSPNSEGDSGAPATEPASEPAPAAETPAPAPEPAPASEGAAAESSISFLDFLFLKPKQALAIEQELETSNTAPTTTTPAVIENLPTENTASTTEPTAEAPVLENDGLLEVLYTINGSDWKTLGIVKSTDLKDAEFELPLEDFVSWEDLSRLQVSLRSPSFADSNITTYVDSMWLEVAYGDEEADEEDLNGYKRKKINFSDIFELDKLNFGADEGIDVRYDVTQLPVTPEGDSSVNPAPSSSLSPVEPAASTDAAASSTPAADETPKDTSSGASGEPAPVLEPTPAVTPTPASEPTPEPAPEPVSVSDKKKVDNSAKHLSFTKFLKDLSQFKLFTRVANASSLEEGVAVIHIIGPDGKELPNRITTRISGKNKKGNIQIPKPGNAFKPGKYKLRSEVLIDGTVYESEETFTWGVLAINLNKSIYTPHEQAYIQIATLLNTGSTYCQANLELRIKRKADWIVGAPVQMYSTNDAITRNGTCGQNNVTDEPDYFLNYEIGEVGEYEIELKNLDTGFAVTDSFKVENESPFVIERVGATRINPFKSKYTMHVKVTAKEDWKGYIEEKVPAVFLIDTPATEIPEYTVRDHEGEKILRWNTKLDAGESIELAYTYDAPKVSPQFYLLGPMKVFDPNFIQSVLGLQDGAIFEEVREWQIASDAIGLRAVSDGSAVGASGNVSVVMPTGTTENDIMIMAVMGRDNVEVSLPAGWTKYIAFNNSTTIRATMAWKRAAAGEAGPYTVTHTAGGSIIAAIASFSGVTSTGSPILATSTSANASSATTTAAATTTATANAMAIFTSHVQDDNLHTDASWRCATDPTSLVEAFDYNTALGTDAALAMATNLRAGTGTTGICTALQAAADPSVGTITLLKAHTITVSGIIYTNEGSSQMTTAGKTIKVVVNGTAFSTTTNSGTGVWHVAGVDAPSLNGTVTVFVDGDSGLRAYTVTKASSSVNNITGVDLYQNRVIVKAEATSTAVTIADMAYDADNDADIQFTANSNVLTVNAGQEMHVWQNMIFTPGGTITLKGNAAAAPDGDFHLDDGATFNAGGAISLAGNWTADASTTAVSNGYGVTFNATTTGKTITLPSTGDNSFGSITFNGSGGAWTFTSNASTTGDFTITNGSTTAPSVLYIGGNYTNNGVFSHGGGTIYLTGNGKTMSGTLTGGSALNNVVIGNAGASAGDPTAWYHLGWDNRKKITLQGTKIATTSTAFPVLIDTVITAAQSDGDDILFTDDNGTTKLPHEIESYNSTTGRLIAWVKTSVASSTNKAIYMYYGNAATSSEQLVTQVWDSNYIQVQHLEETAACATTFTDSSTNGTNGSCSSSPTATSSGKINGARSFNGSSDYITFTDLAAMNNTEFSGSAWVYHKTITSPDWIFSKGTAALTGISFVRDDVATQSARPDTYKIVIGDNAGGNIRIEGASNTSPLATWTHVAFTFKSGTSNGLRLYINAIEDANSPTSTVAVANTNWTSGFKIGASQVPNEYFDGVIDEIRVSNVVRSAGWILTEYNNQSSTSTFYTVGSEQSRGWYGSGWGYRKPITLQGTKIATTTDGFPVLIDFTDIGLSTTTQADADDIVFTSADGLTKLPHEIELYASTTGRVVAWVKTSLASSTNKVLYMYYGNAATSSEQLVSSVWDSNYIQVQHLEETGTCPTTFTDSSNNGTNGSCKISPTATSSGKIGYARSFNGTTDSITYTDLLAMENAEVSGSAWVYHKTITGDDYILLKGASGSGGVALFRDDVGASGRTDVYTIAVGNNGGLVTRVESVTNSSPQETWTHVAFTFKTNTASNGLKLYVNGIEDTNSPTSTTDNITTNWAAGLAIGESNSASFFDGVIDEVRISTNVRSAGWILTEYNNQSSTSTFTTLGTNEVYSAATSYTISSSNASTTALTINSGSLLTGPSAGLSILGNYTNSGLFTAPATTTFTGVSQQTLSGEMTGSNKFTGLVFTNSSGSDPDSSPSIIISDSLSATTFAITTPSVKVRFGAGKTYTFTNVNWNGQAVGTRVQLRSSATTTSWNLAVSGSQTVKNTNPVDSDASGGSQIDASDGTSLDGTRNTNWSFSAASVSCSSNISTTTLGELSLVGVSTASPHATTTHSCTSSSGCTISISSTGNGSTAGLYKSAGAYLLPSATTTLSAGTEGYGIQAATSTAGTGANLSINSAFFKSGNDVGGLTYANTTLASTTTTYSSKELIVTHKAAISAISPIGSYADTITYSCLAN